MFRYPAGLVPERLGAPVHVLHCCCKQQNSKHSFLVLWMWTDVINKEKKIEDPPSELARSTDKHLGMLPAALQGPIPRVPELALTWQRTTWATNFIWLMGEHGTASCHSNKWFGKSFLKQIKATV